MAKGKTKKAGKVKGIIALILVVAIAFGGLMLFGVISFAPKFDNLDGTWVYVNKNDSATVIDIDVEEKVVNLVSDVGVEIPIFAAKQIRYHSNDEDVSSHRTYGKYSKICFNDGATIGSSYSTSDGFVFYPLGETVMWVKVPSSMGNRVSDGIYRKCNTKVEYDEVHESNELLVEAIYNLGELVECGEDFDATDLTDLLYTTVNFDALIGTWAYNFGMKSYNLTFAKHGEEYCFEIGGKEYTIQSANLLSCYYGLAIYGEAENGWEYELQVLEFSNDFLTIKYQDDYTDIYFCKKLNG